MVVNPELALTTSKLSFYLLSLSVRGLLTLLLEVSFMALFPACSMFVCADTSLSHTKLQMLCIINKYSLTKSKDSIDYIIY